ncbi:unnamed protein product [Moneuplotes crassus]|uniref:Uncharacterized protein n=1 Tax=Euplotes crassus TaxID=5936 RepID=A0AAD1XW76_EUPCR|nr:unnamed protein product [Moneuplotes crassus]
MKLEDVMFTSFIQIGINFINILVHPLNCTVYKEYINSATNLYSITPISVGGYEYGIFSLDFSTQYKIIRGRIFDLDRFSVLNSQTTTFLPITTSFVVSDSGVISALTKTSLSINQELINNAATVQSADIAINSGGASNIILHSALWNDDFSNSYLPNSHTNVTFIWACSHPSNFVTISFGLQSLDGEIVPNWVYLDATNEILTLNRTPSVFQDTVYKFALSIDDGTISTQKKFYITVKQCAVSNCKTCQTDDPDKCNKCDTGYSLSNSNTQCSKADASSEAIMAQSVIGVGIAVAIASAAASMSSPVGMFSLINQFQMYLLLPLVPPYFPAKVAQFILGVDFSFVSLDFIPVEKIPLVKEIKEAVDYPQEDSYLDDIGLTSSSSIVNYLPMVCFILVMSLFHLTLSLIYVCCKHPFKHRVGQKIVMFMFVYMTFGFYIRLIMENFLFQMVSILFELRAFKYDTTVSLVSLILCIFFTICITVFIIMIALSFIAGWKNPSSEFHNHWTTKELYSGIKINRCSKANSIAFIGVRFISILLLVLMDGTAKSDKDNQADNVTAVYYIKCVFLLLIHVLPCLFLFIIRPYDSVTNNVIEFIHQLNYTVAIAPLLFLKFESDWSTMKEDMYIQVLLAGPMFGVLINLGTLILIMCKKLIKEKSNNKINIKKILKASTSNQKESNASQNSKLGLKEESKNSNIHPRHNIY